MFLRKQRVEPKSPNTFYTTGEEIANGITHGIGAGLSAIGLVFLLTAAILRGDMWQIVSYAIYGTTLTILYLASTLYHSIQHRRFKPLLQIVDHACIYLFIAGTYTPFLLISLRGTWGWTLLAVVWSLALAGIVFKAFFINRFEVLATIGYLLMGWMCLLAYEQLLAHVPGSSFVWLMIGGAVYTTGVIFYAWERLPYNHAIWHLFVLGGSLCHYVAIYSLIPGI